MAKLYRIPTKYLTVFVLFIAGTAAVSGQNPVANFTGSPVAGCSPLIAIFTDQSTGNPNTWAWDFGNGNTSTLQNPTATYFTPGTYTVSLTVSNGVTSNTMTRTQYITVYDRPVVNFSADVNSGCFPLRVQFTDMSSGGLGNTNVSWEWDFGNGITSTAQNPAMTYTTAGNFNVTLKVTNDKGCVRTLSRPNYIVVTPGVDAGFTHTQPSVCSAPAVINFTNSSTGPPTLSYSWDFGDGNFSTAANPAHIYTSNGTYMVTLTTISSAGCQDTFRIAVPIVIGGFTTSFNAPASVCINELVSFTNTSSPAPLSSVWDFGDGNTATAFDTTHSYASPGVYTIRLYNTYSLCQDSTSQTITVNPRPVANFTAPATSRCEPPFTVNFQDLSTGGAVSWLWNFGDGGTSTLQNPTHTYTTYGLFTVTLIATNGSGCTDTLVIPDFITIRRAIININGIPARGCIPHTVNLTPVISSVDAVTSYDWDFGDGGTSTLQNPSYTYVTQGTYNVRLIITTSGGCRDTMTMLTAVRVGSKPVADFTATPLAVCANQPVQFTDLSVPADEWRWDFGDGGTSIFQNPAHIYRDTGFFTVRLIAINNGCPDTIIKNNYVYTLPPVARFLITPDCSNRLRFSFMDNSVAPVSWSWDFGDGGTSTLQNPVHVFPSLGTYPVRLVVTNGGCSDTVTLNVMAIDQNPDFVADQLTGCKNALINFTVTNINPGLIVNYTWDFGDGNPPVSTTFPTASVLYSVSGNYTVTLIITDLNGCRDTTVKTSLIRINGPLANFSATNVAGCAGLTTTFTDLSTTDGTNALTNWQFNFGDGVTQNFASPPFQHTYSIAGSFNVLLILTDAAGCIDSITYNNLVTTSDPVPDFRAGDTLSCPGATVSFNNMTLSNTPFTSQWSFGDGGTSTVTHPGHIYTANGFYDVRLIITDSLGCTDSITKNLYIRVDGPVASFTASDTTGSCTPLEIQFTNTSTFIYTLMWDFGPGQGTSTLNNPIHFYSLPGTYPVKLVVTGPGGCMDSVIQIITVYDTSGARVDYAPVGGCKPLAINLNVFSPGPMASYFWDFGDGTTMTTTTPVANHVYRSFGNFLPKVIMEDPAGCPIPLQGLDTVLVTGADAKFGYDSSFFCDRGLVSFTDSTIFNDPIATFIWDFGDGGNSNLQNPIHQYNAPGLFDVSLTVVTQSGCRDTATKQTAVKIVLSPQTDIGGDTVLCVNSTLTHLGVFTIPDTSVVTWAWNFPNGNASTVQYPPPQRYTVPGTFVLRSITQNSSGCRDTTTRNIIVHSLPVVTMPTQMTIQNGFPVVIPAIYSPNTVNWIWAPATGLSCADCPNPLAGPKLTTDYQVYFTDNNGCSNIASLRVDVICKNTNLFIPNTFSPNGDGSNDRFYPRGRGLERVRSLRIFNRWGEVVFEKREFPLNDPAYGWDGTFKGKKHPDVYVYQAEIFCENGEIIRLNGNIALIL